MLDSDTSMISNVQFEKEMKPMARMLPYLLKAAGLFDIRTNLDLRLADFDVRRQLGDKVPQSQRR